MHTALCLFDLPGLDRLADVCSEFKIRLTAHGGLVRRLVMRLPSDGPWNNLSFDLFDLVPFASDIDLIHDGKEALTAQIQDSVYRHIPNAECFRWELRSAASRTVFETAVRLNNFIPATLMRLSTLPGSGIWDPWGGWDDIKTGSYRYIRNGFYTGSPLYKAGRDMELFSALLYLQAILEAELPIDRLKNQPGMGDVRAVIADAASDRASMIALQESAYLRGRLLYLFKNLVAAARSATALDVALKESGFTSLQSVLDQNVGALANAIKSLYPSPPKALVVTGRLGGDLFRLPHTTDAWVSKDAPQRLGDALESSLQLKGVAVDDALGAEQRVLLASPRIQVNEGRTPSARVAPELSASATLVLSQSCETEFPPATGDASVHEFVHFAVALSKQDWQTLSAFDDASLTAVLAVHAAQDKVPDSQVVSQGCVLFPVPVACQLRPRDGAGEERPLLFLRCNCLRVLEDAGLICDRLLATASKPYLQVFVLGLMMPDEV